MKVGQRNGGLKMEVLWLEGEFRITHDADKELIKLWQWSVRVKVWKVIDEEHLSETIRMWRDRIQLQGDD